MQSVLYAVITYTHHDEMQIYCRVDLQPTQREAEKTIESNATKLLYIVPLAHVINETYAALWHFPVRHFWPK